MAERLVVLNAARTPPFYINEDAPVDERLRLKYRYLDLRRAALRDTIILRHRVVKHMRDFLDARGLRRDRDAHPDQEHAGGGARLPRPLPPPPRGVLRPAPGARSSSSSC